MAEKKLTSYPKEKINILFLENISDAAVKYFNNAGYTSVKKLSGALSEDQLIKEIKNVHLLGIRSKTQITKKVLDAAEKLQAIGCFCIGTNQVDLKEATQKGRKQGGPRSTKSGKGGKCGRDGEESYRS